MSLVYGNTRSSEHEKLRRTAFLPHLKLLAIGTGFGRVKLYDPDTQNYIAVLPYEFSEDISHLYYDKKQRLMFCGGKDG